MLLKSTYTDENELLEDMIGFYSPLGIDLDPCYSKGNFYKSIQEPRHAYDIAPQFDFVKESCATKIDLQDASLQSIMFDPPFLATTGPSLQTTEGNIINRRFSVFPSEKALLQFYRDAMENFYRMLQPGGFLFFKCQDKVSSGKQYFSHVYIHEIAYSLGFYPKDLFILVKSNRIVADWQRNQQHARKFHCYYWVFEKIAPKVSWRTLLNEE